MGAVDNQEDDDDDDGGAEPGFVGAAAGDLLGFYLGDKSGRFWCVLEPKVQDELGVGRSPAVSAALGSSWNSGNKNRIKLFIEALKLYKNGMISITSLLLQLLSTRVVLGALLAPFRSPFFRSPFPYWSSHLWGLCAVLLD